MKIVSSTLVFIKDFDSNPFTNTKLLSTLLNREQKGKVIICLQPMSHNAATKWLHLGNKPYLEDKFV